MHRPWVRVLIAVAAAFTYGWVTGRVPAPSDPAAFWIGNLAGPYIVIGFLAGAWATRRALPAAATGAAAALATVCGFYDVLAVGVDAHRKWALPASTPELTAVRIAYAHWLRLLVLGSRPWLVIGLVTGAAAGYLGHRWAARANRSGVVAVGIALIAEPGVYLAKLTPDLGLGFAYDLRPANVAIWGVEALAGLGAIAYARRRRPASAGPSDPGARPAPSAPRDPGAPPAPAAPVGEPAGMPDRLR